jgi:hypothetical protein
VFLIHIFVAISQFLIGEFRVAAHVVVVIRWATWEKHGEAFFEQEIAGRLVGGGGGDGMGNERQIEMLRAKVVASMPLRKSQQSKNSVAVEEREEGELSAEDEESLVPAMVSSSPPPLLRVFFFCFTPFLLPPPSIPLLPKSRSVFFSSSQICSLCVIRCCLSYEGF